MTKVIHENNPESVSVDTDFSIELNNNGYNPLSLLSKREARRVLHIGNRNLNKLINDGKIKVVDVNGKIKIPYRNLEEYIYEASQASAKADFPDSFDYLPEDAVNEIIKEIIKEHK